MNLGNLLPSTRSVLIPGGILFLFFWKTPFLVVFQWTTKDKKEQGPRKVEDREQGQERNVYDFTLKTPVRFPVREQYATTVSDNL